MGLFVSFEGGEGTGKSTQAQLLQERLASQGYQVVAVREPGGTELGDYLRGYLKATDQPLTSEAELFLFVAARSELVRRVLRPALATGKVVVADRYADSTTAYQGYGRRLSLQYVRSANLTATGGLWPDLTVLLDGDPQLLLARASVQTLLEDSRTEADRERDGARRAPESGMQRFERAPTAFHTRVRAGYLKLAESEPERWHVLDATQAPTRIAELVWAEVSSRMAKAASQNRAGARLPGM